MIKVIGKKKEEKKIYKTLCDECMVELEYEESDTHIGAYGCRELICPECGARVLAESPDGIDLDETNIEFPAHFAYTSDDAVDIDDQTIQGWVRECLQGLKEDEGDKFNIIESGNTVVIALKYEKECDVYVAKKHYHSYVEV